MERTLYGRRVGKPLRAYQSSLIADLLPRVAVDVSAPIHPETLFAAPLDTLRLEIGFGGGEHLAREAAESPQVGFIGCEPFVNGVAKMLGRIEAQKLANVRLHMGDARDVLVRLPRACLTHVDLLYPDPWPKRRQRKRRFVDDETLALIAAALKPGGIFRFASDIDDYTGWTLAHLLRSTDFRWEATRPADWAAWPNWQPTRYEEKARREGRDSVYLTFSRL